MAEEDLRQKRLNKIERLREAGCNPYPERFERTHRLNEACQLEEGTEGVRIAGRLTAFRPFGKLSFGRLQDIHGSMQVAFQRDLIGTDTYQLIKKTIDIGDFIGVEGEVFRTKTGELTIRVAHHEFLGKSLRPLPEKWHGLQDRETIYRQRYLDLIASPESRELFLLRTQVIQTLRRYLDEHGFQEVDTPILCNKATGALARPFKTHHNALNMEVFLRIAPETYLKRLIVAGYDRVYEMARCFRNEGMDPSHLQDFTMLEYYAAYWNYEDNMRFTEELFRFMLETCLGSLQIEIDGVTIDFSKKWKRLSLREGLLEETGIDVDQCPDAEALREKISAAGIEIEKAATLGRGALIDSLYKKTVRKKLIQPTFLVQHPIDLSPLARRNDENTNLTDRFQLVVAGWEIVNAYSELVDPIDQRNRLEEQAALRAAGDDEAMELDEDYLLAMEHGMPPISGWGMGIDRIVTLLTGQDNLRDVVPFPLLKNL